MEFTFTKGAGKHDQMRVVRGGIAETINCPKQRIVPHEMVHYAVECTLRKRGFLGRFCDGEPANFLMVAEAESDGVERLVEVFQGDAWSGDTALAKDMLDLYRVTCSARECPALPVTADDIALVRAKLDELDAQWQALAVGEFMILRL